MPAVALVCFLAAQPFALGQDAGASARDTKSAKQVAGDQEKPSAAATDKPAAQKPAAQADPAAQEKAREQAAAQERRAAAIEFVHAEPRPLRMLVRARTASDANVARHCFAAVIETRPPLGRITTEKDADKIIVKALGSVLGWKNPDKPPARRNRADLNMGAAFIEHQTVRGEAAPDELIADRWTITAADEPTARAVANAFLAGFDDYAAQQVGRVQRNRKNLRAEADKLRDTLAQLEKKIPELEEESRKLGVDQLSTQSIDEALARFDQERRLTEIDIAGLQASLASATSRLASLRGATHAGRGEIGGADGSPATGRGTNGQVDAGAAEETARALYRLQVELELQLVGKLTRQETIAREREQLRKGRENRAEIEDLRAQLAQTRRDIQTHDEKLLPAEDQSLAKVEQLRGAADVEQVTLMPVSQ